LWQTVGEPRTFASLVILYCALHVLVRFLLSPNLNLGEAEQMLFGQSLQPSYRPDEPPLMNWLTWAVLGLAQNSRLALFLLREVLLGIALIAYFAAARLVIGDGRRAAFAAFFLLGTFGMGWLVHVGRFETVLLAAMCALYLWADARALTRGSVADYAILGVVTGLGVLSSYVFLILLFAMSVAVALTPELRAQLKLQPLLLAAAIAVVIVLPYLWFASGTVAAANEKHLSELAVVSNFLLALILFAIPAVLAFPILYPRACLPLPEDRQHNSWLRFYKIAMAAALVTSLAAALLFRSGDAKESWIYPVLLPLPIYLFLRAKLAYFDSEARDRRFFVFIAVCIVAAIAARVAMYEFGAKTYRNYVEYWPFARYADSFRQAGFVSGTIAAPEPGLAGNLRLHFPDARVVTPQAPADTFGAPVPGECLVVWKGDANLPPRLRDYVTQTYGAKLQDRAVQGDVEAAPLKGKGPLARVNFLILAQGACDHPRT
jgi:4-amino-4-deoxy-L-arabinose transferase-like glycosyltransferase